MGRDHTIFATAEGAVEFRRASGGRTFISVAPRS
jgi:large subunit ribosomal protein L27